MDDLMKYLDNLTSLGYRVDIVGRLCYNDAGLDITLSRGDWEIKFSPSAYDVQILRNYPPVADSLIQRFELAREELARKEVI